MCRSMNSGRDSAQVGGPAFCETVTVRASTKLLRTPMKRGLKLVGFVGCNSETSPCPLKGGMDSESPRIAPRIGVRRYRIGLSYAAALLLFPVRTDHAETHP